MVALARWAVVKADCFVDCPGGVSEPLHRDRYADGGHQNPRFVRTIEDGYWGVSSMLILIFDGTSQQQSCSAKVNRSKPEFS